MVGINHLTLSLKFGVLRRNIHEISNKQYLLQGFYLKIVSKSALHVYFPPFQVLFSHILGII